ncbi:MAG TPA: translocation/assembly module TamB domain-containing protein, partial [Bdellovibrionota bacterium]|nr:translocation/assembly module TamB domain-containing protein [Bdellovibrionota bacterium]
QGIADLKGTLKPFAFKEGRATFQKLIIQRGTIVFQNREPIDVRVMEGTLHIQPFHLVGGQTDLLISGSLDPNSELNLQLNGGFDLALLEVFAKPITRASGTARVQARISGTVRNPSLLGNLSLYQAALQTAWLPQPIEQINGDIVFSKQLISIERARGIWGGGPISAQGSISWPENAPVTFSLNMTSRNNRIQLIRGFHTRISSDLHFSGQTRPYLLSGEITIEEAVYKERIDWQTNLFKQKPKYGPKVIREELPLIGLDVAIDASRGIRVDNNLAKMAFQGQLQLVGSIENPNLVGKFDLIDGKTFFQDNEFKLTGGEIEFNDPLEINPYFHLQAESKVRDYLVSVALIGYLGDYEVQLASQPPLSEPDIAALLTLGVTAGEVAGQEGQFAAVELGSLLFGGVSQAIERQIGLPITFRSTPSYSTTKEATVPKVIVGTKITDQIDASFSTTIGESAVFEDKEARIRYKFNDNLSLQGVWEDETQTQQLNDDSKIGVDLNYQFEFK